MEVIPTSPLADTESLLEELREGEDQRFGWRPMLGFAVSVIALTLAAFLVFGIFLPRFGLLHVQDASRTIAATQLENALYQSLFDPQSGVDVSAFPEGADHAKPVCKQGVVTDDGCVNVDVLSPRFLARIPEDFTEKCATYTGYSIYREGSRVRVMPSHAGKIVDDTVSEVCGRAK